MKAALAVVTTRPSGISSANVARPVLLFSFFAMVVTALASLWLTPLSLHLETKMARTFAAAQFTGNIESRISMSNFRIRCSTSATWSHRVRK